MNYRGPVRCAGLVSVAPISPAASGAKESALAD